MDLLAFNKALAEFVSGISPDHRDGVRLNMFTRVDALGDLSKDVFGVTKSQLFDGTAYIRRFAESGYDDADIAPHYPALLLQVTDGRPVAQSCGAAINWNCVLSVVSPYRQIGIASDAQEPIDARNKTVIDNDALESLSLIFAHLKSIKAMPLDASYNFTEGVLSQDVLTGATMRFTVRLDSTPDALTPEPVTVTKTTHNIL